MSTAEQPMRHVFVCTTLYRDHWEKTVNKKLAEAAKRTDAEKQATQAVKPEEHADGHVGPHCGELIGGDLFEAFKSRLAERGLTDVLLSPNACIAQHIAGCIAMVYPDGVWYALGSVADVDRVIDEHLIGGQCVEELVHRRLKDPAGRGLGCMLDTADEARTE